MAAPNTHPPRPAVLLIVLGGLAQLGFLATQIGHASNKLLVTEVVAPPLAALTIYAIWRALHRDPHAPSLLTMVQIRMGSTTSLAVVAAGLCYLLITGWLMTVASYDIWGAFVAAPAMGWIAVRAVQRVLKGDLEVLQRAALAGLAAKAAGTAARYWVANDAYGGASDATEYHNVGKRLFSAMYNGERSILDMIPHSQGTKFIGELTGLLYSFVGSSRLAGFFWFGLLGYLGVLLTVKAATLAVPGLVTRRYAWLCFLMPSLVFWPSSVGKEAWLSLTVGTMSLGVAHVFGGHARVGVIWVAAGAAGTAMVRPHLALIGLAGLVLAAVVTVFGTRVSETTRRRRPVILVITLISLVGITFLGRLTLEFLNPDDGTSTSLTNQVTSILDTASKRTAEAGSSFTPVQINGPIDYPEAIVRTLTRPMLYEAKNIATLLPALEMTFYVGLCLASWRRLARLPSVLIRSPFAMYATTMLLLFGLGWASFGNLAILVRQRSLVMPFLLLLPCLPDPRPLLTAPLRNVAPTHMWHQPARGGSR
ncbi:MAG: hypothetical protein Q7V57_17550 [Actinomycetota bacterium]|nr:hypothetical protein [Actinomycetota bacterium]